MLQNKKKKRMILLLAVGLPLLAALLILLIGVDNRTVHYEDFVLDAGGERELRIAHLSDLHFPKQRVDTGALLASVQVYAPDLVAVTGDLIDRSAGAETSGAYAFIERLTEIAPVFYVNGNHEADNATAPQLYAFLSGAGVTVLKNESVNLTVREVRLTVIGVTDNADYGARCYVTNGEAANNYRILLAHRPEKQAQYDADALPPHLVLSGHVHGGQIRLFNKGLIAPSQGLFPKWDGGRYDSAGDRTMIVSRGIGSSIFPFRIYNRPHVPLITVRM